MQAVTTIPTNKDAKASAAQASFSKIAPTLLLVDDEPDILDALKRALRKEKFSVLTAANGEEAKQKLQEHNVHIVLTDLRMPKMDGETLLEYVAQAHPSVYRMVLTGYAELASVKRAVNKGNIHCYLEKPWHNEALVGALGDARHKVINLHTERQYIRKVTSAKNALTKRNSALENAVRERTAQLRESYEQVQQDKLAMSQMLFNMVTVCPHLDAKFALNVSDLAVKIAECMGLTAIECDDIQLAGKLCEIGLVGIGGELLHKPISKLNYHQRQVYLSQIDYAEQLLGPACNLNGVLEAITQQFELADGRGYPAKQLAMHTSLPAQILAVARDVWLLASARQTGEKVSERRIRQYIQRNAGKRYAQDVVEAALSMPKLIGGYASLANTPVVALKPGMTLLSNLYSSQFLLIYPKGHMLTRESIARIKRVEANSGKLLNVQASIVEEPEY